LRFSWHPHGCNTEDIYQAFEPKQPTVLRVLEDAVSVPAWWLQGAMSTSQKKSRAGT